MIRASVEANIRKGIPRPSLLKFSAATQQLFHTGGVISLAELCGKSGFESRCALQHIGGAHRAADSKSINGSPHLPRPTAR